MNNIIDRNNIIHKFKNGIINEPVILELGCGNRKRIKKSVGIDAINYDSVDLVGDIYDVLRQLPNHIASEVHSSHFFEHIDDIGLLMSEIERIMTKGGILHTTVPHFSNSYYYSDYTHKTFYGLYTFCYFSNNAFFKRKVPQYSMPKYELLSVELVFKSPPPFYFRHGIRRIIGFIINSSRYMKEYYEENLCRVISCYEIKYIMRKL
jgi:hypothetical protein